MEDIIVKVLLGEASAQEIEALEAWKAEAAANRQQVEDFRKILAVSKGQDVDVEVAWSKFQKRVKTPIHRWRLRTFAAAAVLVLVSGISWWFVGQKPEDIVVNAGAKVRTTTLSDGSVITLNKFARIAYREDYAAERKITLEGEAFFEVAPDPDKPFVIHTPDLQVRVLGTSFNVKSTKNFTEVVVETGKVEVEQAGSSTRLVAGESLKIDAVSRRKKRSENTFYQYYRTGTLDCNNTPLSELCTALSEIYGVDIRVDNPRVGERRITTVFREQSLDETLLIIAQTMDVKIDKHGESYLIR